MRLITLIVKIIMILSGRFFEEKANGATIWFMPAAIEWTIELQTSILQGIESGLTVRQVAQNNGISDSLIFKHVREDELFCKQYTRVMELRTERDFEGLEDELNEAPETVSTKFGSMVDSGWVAWKRLQIDTRKWALSKRNPKKYGDSAKLQLTGDDGGPLIVKHIGSDGE